MKNILITGCAGFIGFHLAKSLLKSKNYKIIGIDNLDIRLISEYNDFSEQVFLQPLISWRPNPDTIFYLGGNQNYINNFIDYNSPHYRVNKTQLFLKFQYLIK